MGSGPVSAPASSSALSRRSRRFYSSSGRFCLQAAPWPSPRRWCISSEKRTDRRRQLMAAFEVTFIDVGHGDATLIKTPDDRYILVDCRRCPGEGIDLFRFLDDVLPDGTDGRKRLDILAITHAHDDHITGIGELYDRYQVIELWWPQHGKKLAIAGNYEEFERVEEEHKAAHEGEEDEYLKWPKGSRSHWATFSDDDVTVRCFSPPGFVEPSEELDDEDAKRVVHENCMVLKFTYKGVAVMLTGDSSRPC